MQQRTKLLILFGGQSAEHEVSVNSCRNVYAALDDQKYDVSLVYISKDGRWWLANTLDSLNDLTELMPVLGTGEFVTKTGEFSVKPDVILPILHGPNGEDGSVQGLAQLMNVPVVGCGILGSAVCMDKDVAHRLLGQAGISVVKSVVYYKVQPMPQFEELSSTLGNPLFVKPANMGSSVGVSRVSNQQEFEAAMQEALKYDHKIVIEQGVVGRELECAVLGNQNPEVSEVGEIKPDRDFYSYESKYDPNSTTGLIIPAELPPEVSDQIRNTALKAYKALECRGLSRVDFFLTDGGEVYVNEINTFPGFTNISMYPKLWDHKGLHYPELIDKLVSLALEDK